MEFGAYTFVQHVVVDGGAGVCSVSFDPRYDLIWMGGCGGHITSYLGLACEKYTSFQAHPQGHPVRDLCVHNDGVISLSPTTISMHHRRGITNWILSSDDFIDLFTMSLLGKNEHRLAVSGNQQSLFELDISRKTGQIVRRIALDGTGYKLLRSSPQYLCCADFAGGIDLRSKDNLTVVHRFDSGSMNLMVQDMTVLGNQLVTAVFSENHGRQNYHRHLNVYDLRLRQAQLFPLHCNPMFLKFLETYTTRLVCVSTTGQFQVVDLGRSEGVIPVNSIDPAIFQYPITCFDVCATSQGIVFGDEGGNLFLYGTGQDIRFSNSAREPEFADVIEPPPAMDVLNPLHIYPTIPMPICAGPLLSDLPLSMTRFRYLVAQPLDPSILGSIKMVGSMGYVPNNGRLRRNECNYILNKQPGSTFKGQAQSPSYESQIPLYYQKVDIKYNKLGIEDFDYNQYNATCFAGLESSLPNCYSNDMIQVFYFLEPLRVMLTNHSCEREFCLACELSYLFHMLESAQGMPCQASNFLRAFRTIPEVSALGLLLAEDRFTGCKQLIQGWTRFMFTQLHQETVDEKTGISIITQLFTIPQKTVHRCWCGAVKEREATTNMVHLTYSNIKETPGQVVSFCEVLQQSMCPSGNQINAWCEACVRFSTTMESRRPTALPDILVINCGLDSVAAMEMWMRKGGAVSQEAQAMAGRAGQGDHLSAQFANKKCRFGDKCNRRSCRFQHSDSAVPDQFASARGEGSFAGPPWLPFKLNIAVLPDGSGITVSETESNSGDGINYELAAIVCVILHDGRENIISLVNVGAGYHERHHSSGMSHWYVFNDFTVHSVKECEVGHMPIEWKQPCMLYYTRKDIAAKYKDLQVVSPITDEILRKDTSIGAAARLKTFTPLLETEHFNSGDIVAMDAEFVTLNQEEAEIRSDGTRATIRPSQRSVARISCLRGQGPMEGVAFIDDYIATQEQVVDYLTQFSGIQPGDLDVSVSSKHLTTLKATYQKLRLLVDKGVIFVGHGLKNDFRVVNLVVPQEQVRDTVLLFQLRNKRMLSLRFLAWHFFGETIQSETHDSIEDAKTALRLYRKYLELEERDEINAALTELYEVGKRYNWKVPQDSGSVDGHSNSGTPAAPLD